MTMVVKSEGAEIAYTVMGSGPDVVLLHAFPSDHEMWHPVAENLSRQYRVTLLDLRGHGHSSAGDGPATMQKHVADLSRVCQEAGIGKAIFAGVSIGGYILFEFWRRHREQVRALILCNTRASADSEEARANRLKIAEDVLQRGPDLFFNSMLPKLLGETTRRNRPDLAVRARLTMRGTATSVAAVQLGMAERPDSIPTLKTINIPTLLIAGSEDTTIPISELELMHQNIAGSELRVIPEAGHFSVMEKPEDAIKIMRSFLEKLR
jgi:pimeloyl-ACP methyl ester carboxylesterase